MDLANPGIEPEAPALEMDSSPAELPGKPHTSEGLKKNFLTKEGMIDGMQINKQYISRDKLIELKKLLCCNQLMC